MVGLSAGVERIVVATYNIHQCVGSDGHHQPDRTAAVIREIQADAIALQEVDSRAAGEHGVDQFEFLARATGMHPVEGPTLRDHRGQYGNALLTRLPVLEAQRVDLSVPGREPRGALDVQLKRGGQRIRVIATHLGLRWRERRRQVERIVDLVGLESHEPVVLLGDMNEWVPVAHSLRPLIRALGRAPRHPTFPAVRPLLALDRIWCRPLALLTEVHAHATEVSRLASDHLPLCAELKL